MEKDQKEPIRLIGVEEMAELMDLSRATVCRMARAGEIPSYRAPGRTAPYRFDVAEVMDALKVEPKCEPDC